MGPGDHRVLRGDRGGGATIFADEWLRKPGSVGKPWAYSTIKVLDETGAELPANEIGLVYLFLCDRKSDMITSGGVNIYPAEIEGDLVMHPAVADVTVFGVPDDHWGEAIKAVIQPAEEWFRPTS